MKLAFFLPLAIAIASMPAPVGAQKSLDATIDEFLNMLPDTAADRPPFDPNEFSRLSDLNPGREKDITPILSTYEQCLRPPVDDATKRYLRAMARKMGAAKVAKLIEFYRGADFETYTQVLAKTDAGKNPTAAESASIARMMRTYPLIELNEAIKNEEATVIKDEIFVAAVTKCSLDKRSALNRASLKF